MNPRFVWNIGSIREEYPDMPEPGADVVLWDRKYRAPVVTLHGRYANLVCLEHINYGTPFSDLENWLNRLSTKTLESEDLPT